MTRRIARLLMIVVSLLMLLPSVSVAASEEIPAQAVIRETTDKVLKVLREDGGRLKQDPARLYAIIDELILPRFDFRRMSRWVLGRHWRTATAAQREAFAEAFKDLLVQTYSKALLEFSEEKIQFLKPRLRGDDEVTVRAEVDQGGGPMVPVTYDLALTDGDWKVYDVSIDGVSLVINYRSSFNQEVRRNGLDGLIKRIQERAGKGAG